MKRKYAVVDYLQKHYPPPEGSGEVEVEFLEGYDSIEGPDGSMGFGVFVPTEEKAIGEAFKPIPVRDALEACEGLSSTEVYLEHAYVSEIRLGYVMLAEDRALTQAMARPAWLIRIWGEFEGESESRMIAIDARTGESMLD